MKKLILKYCYNDTDSRDKKLSKFLILAIAICCSFCGIVWSGLLYYFFDISFTTILPLLFVLIISMSIYVSHKIRNYKLLVHSQLICITLFPALLQWCIGTVEDSGFVVAWCFLSPLGALLFLDEKKAKIWMFIFFGTLGITGFGFSPFTDDWMKVTENALSIFFLMNIGVVSIVIFCVANYFFKNLVNQKKHNLMLLKETEQKKESVEKSLNYEKELSNLKTSFISTASHQFRTPLAVIQSNVELLEMFNEKGEPIDNEKYSKVTGRITTAICKMTDLMNDVLTLGKLNSGHVSYFPENVDLVKFSQELVGEFNPVQMDGRNIKLVVEGKPHLVKLDPKLLNHSLSNLVSNAFKYSEGREDPQLILYFRPKEVAIVVKDFGLGISDEEQLHLFEPFFRSENVSEIEGTGLGLNIAKEYVEVNKGTIIAKSILGEGSSFEITFLRNNDES